MNEKNSSGDRRFFAGITALATYLPEKRESTVELVGEDTAKKLGITERPIGEKSETAGDMAYKAAENLFAKYPALKREDIHFVLLCIESPDYLVPNTSCHIAARLNLPKECGAVDYNLGCSGYVYGLSLAKGIIETDLSPNVLLLTCNKSSDYINEKDMNMRPLFGDAATATLLERSESSRELIHSFVFGSDGAGHKMLYQPVGGNRNMPRDYPLEIETDPNGNVRSNYDLHMDGNGIFIFTMRTVPKLVDDVLNQAKLTRDELDYCVFHQPNGFMMQQLQKKCRLTDVPFYNDIEHIGNTVANSVPIGLESVFQKHKPQELNKVMLAGFGIGLSWAGCIADFSCFKSR